ncbi:MAG: hypothetical protein JST65_08140 [Acidobacteria bacterium]|nr:hypothetical protein [Acidobacteriota bacterium]
MDAVVSSAASIHARSIRASSRTWSLGALFLAGCFGPAILYLGLAYYVNPVRDFAVAAGHPFPAVRSDYRNEKLTLLDAYLEAAPRQPVGGLVLGSSRSMLLNAERLGRHTGLRFFNFGLASAKGEDTLAALRWSMGRKGQVPKLVLIGLDVESLRDARSIGDSLHPLRELATGEPSTLEYLEAIVPRMAAWSYARSVLLSIYFAVRPRQPVVGFAPDGTLQYRFLDGQRRAGTFALSADMPGCMALCRRKIEETDALSPAQVRYLKTTVQEAQGAGAKVVVWLTGPHPQTAAFMAVGTEYSQLLSGARAVLGEVAALGAETHDLHDTRSLDPAGEGWYDCNHFDNTNATRVEHVLTASWEQ